MFTKISYIKNFGVFQDYHKPGNIQDFKNLNIIYGWNYSGKTTLARLFSCFEKEELHEDYKSCEFEIIDQNNNKYSNENLHLHDKTVRVFNTDFVRENLKWDGEAFNPILLLGKVSIDAEKAIKEKKNKIERITSINKNINTVYKTLKEEIEGGLSNKASNIKKNLRLVEPFTKFHLRRILEYVRKDHVDFIVDSKKENRLLRDATASVDDKLPKLEEYTPSITLSDLIDESADLLKLIPEFSKTIDYFLDYPEVATWVEAGLPLHDGKERCEYCGNIIPQQRKDDLLAHFSENLTNHKTSINELRGRLSDSKIQLPQHSKRDYYQSLWDDFTTASANLKASIKEYNKQLDRLHSNLVAKRDKPFEAITDLSTITDCSSIALQHISAFNSTIRKNNKITEKFDELKTKAIATLKRHYTAQFIDDINLAKKEKKISLYKSRERSLTTAKQALDTEILKLEAQISGAQIGREEINKYIHRFLDREEIKVKVQKEGEKERFILKRDNKKAVNLSEGEKTAIAFSFFLTKLKEIEDLKSAIVYIDDPVSSLDSNHIFQLNALLKDFFFLKDDDNGSWVLKCDQLFISTHSFDFYSLIRELPKKKKKPNTSNGLQHSSYMVRRISKDDATLDRLPKALEKYKSEYHYLFSLIYNYYNSSNKADYSSLINIPNAVRRFVELYTYTRIPANISSSVDDRANQLWGVEKSKRILKVLHYFSHTSSIELMTKHDDLICDIENAITDLIKELSQDKSHYRELVKSVSS